jgi:type VI secretion system secreted protein Hcp
MATVDNFLKIDGVDGESTDDTHKAEIEVLSWAFAGSNAGSFDSNSGGGTGKVALQDFSFTAYASKASPLLFKNCCSGEHMKKATLTCRKAGGGQQEFLIIELSPVLVSSISAAGSSGGDAKPMESVTLAFGKIEIKYKEQKPDGSLGGEIIASHDVTTNKTA